MLSRTVCAGFAVFSALVGMANLAAADRSDLRPIGVCIDKPGTGTFVGVAVWTSCNDADGTARTKARGFAEGFARNGCGASLTAAEGRMICAGRGGILVTTTPYLSNTNNYAISINAPHGFCSRIQDGDLKPTFSSTKKCGTQPPSWWHGPWWGNWAEQTATATNQATCGYVCSR
jgi:hypothetical protein